MPVTGDTVLFEEDASTSLNLWVPRQGPAGDRVAELPSIPALGKGLASEVQPV